MLEKCFFNDVALGIAIYGGVTLISFLLAYLGYHLAKKRKKPK